MMPWKLLGDFSSYIFGWLVGYSGLLGPDRRRYDRRLFSRAPRALNLDDLYRRGGTTNMKTASTGALSPL